MRQTKNSVGLASSVSQGTTTPQHQKESSKQHDNDVIFLPKTNSPGGTEQKYYSFVRPISASS